MYLDSLKSSAWKEYSGMRVVFYMKYFIINFIYLPDICMYLDGNKGCNISCELHRKFSPPYKMVFVE